MKTALLILTALILIIIVLLFILGMVSKSGETPGLVRGMLSKCPDKPNCVCSEYQEDAAHYIDPIPIPQGGNTALLPMLKSIIQEMGGTLQAEHENYLTATFTSAIFGFVDDLEIRIDPTKQLIQLRSGSRVGYSDGGVNRKRYEQFKTIFKARVSPFIHN